MQTAEAIEASAAVAPVHALPGRIRFRVEGLYRNEALERTLEQALRSDADIRSAHANHLTGTVLVRFAVNNHSVADLTERVAALLPPELRSVSATRRSAPRPRPLSGLLRRTTPSQPVPAAESAPIPSSAWHTQSRHEVQAVLETDRDRGLGSAEAHARLLRYGANELPRPGRRSDLGIFLEQFVSLPVGLLGVSAAVSIATGGLLDAGVILGVVLINAVIGYATERNAEKTIGALSRIAPTRAIALRDGEPRDLSADELVPGDVVQLSPGSNIPADLRLLKSHRLSVDESALTGESMPVRKDAEFVAAAETALGDRGNMAYMGTIVSGGSGLGAVVATAANSELGRIHTLVGEAQAPETPMQRQLGRMGTQLALLSGAVCAGVFGFGLLRGYSFLEMLKASISLAVAAVPEGLPAVATTTLALGIQRMRREQVAIRHMDAVETLGAVQVFCLDKTGTLTQNRMAVVAAHFDGSAKAVQDGRFLRDGRAITEPHPSESLNRLLQVVSLCNEARVADGAVREGSATEAALLDLALATGIDIAALRRRYPMFKVRYRSEGRPYMVTLHGDGDGHDLVAVKGSPEQVLELCAWQMLGNDRTTLDEASREAILRENERMAGDALRVLGIAYAYVEHGTPIKEAVHDLHWLGLVGMADPLRTGMPELMRTFHRAGVRTAMITGDQSATAYAIGKQLGLAGDGELQILDSASLDKLDPELLRGLVKNVHVFSRVSPAHKLRIVRAIQESGNVVAMTGDGINDGPALKAADIGVAMGGSGSDVARSVADVVLEDDNLHTMVVAVERGRTIYGNIRKTIHFLLATNFTEIEVMLAGIAIGQGTPLNPMQLLWINLISDIFPGLALSLEPPEPDTLERPPRDPNEPIVRRSDLARMGLESAVITGGAMAGYGYGLWRYGPGPAAGTLAFTTLTFGQLLHAFSCRSDVHTLFKPGELPRNRYLNWAMGGSLGLQLLAALVPGLRKLLGTVPLGPADVLVAAAGSILPLLINETTKTLSTQRSLPAPPAVDTSEAPKP